MWIQRAAEEGQKEKLKLCIIRENHKIFNIKSCENCEGHQKIFELLEIGNFEQNLLRNWGLLNNYVT